MLSLMTKRETPESFNIALTKSRVVLTVAGQLSSN